MEGFVGLVWSRGQFCEFLRDASDENFDTDDAIEVLHQKILDSYNLCCPIKTKIIYKNNDDKPWITNAIKKNIKKHNLFILKKNGKISE